jgi:hypothetical protein
MAVRPTTTSYHAPTAYARRSQTSQNSAVRRQAGLWPDFMVVRRRKAQCFSAMRSDAMARSVT